MDSFPTIDRRRRGQRSWQRGHRNEWWAALYLMAKGYQILGFRLKTPRAEIDILARQGRHLVAVEVKSRQSAEIADYSLLPDQQIRLSDAVTRLCRTRPSFRKLEPRLDLLTLSPGRLPKHIKGLVIYGRDHS